jgi:ornithine cyclodeaminase/alanine dehydrogenase-like protein (mu-crystallin family)
MKPVATLILSGEDIASAMSMSDYIVAVEQAFAKWAGSGMDVPPVVHVAAPGGGFHVKSAAFREAPHYVAVKVNGNFPGNPQESGLPTIQGAILLADARNGSLLAVMDSTEVTAMRTGAATAVAAKHLAPRRARTATVIGCGIQGRVQLLSLLEVFSLERVFVADADVSRARRFAAALQDESGCEVEAVEDFATAAPYSEVIVTCTPARRAFLGSAHVSPGTFIAAVGADNGDKQEIEPELMAKSRVVVDSLDQCLEIGDLHHAVTAGAMSRDGVAAELGAVVAGKVDPHISPEDIVVFDSTGVAIQDVSAAGVIYERCKAGDVGHWVTLN